MVVSLAPGPDQRNLFGFGSPWARRRRSWWSLARGGHQQSGRGAGVWLPLRGEVTAGGASLPALRHLHRERAEREAVPGASGRGFPGGTLEAAGRAGEGAGKWPSLPSPLPAGRSGAAVPWTLGVGPRRDGGRGRAAFESHWRTRPPEADK